MNFEMVSDTKRVGGCMKFEMVSDTIWGWVVGRFQNWQLVALSLYVVSYSYLPKLGSTGSTATEGQIGKNRGDFEIEARARSARTVNEVLSQTFIKNHFYS